MFLPPKPIARHPVETHIKYATNGNETVFLPNKPVHRTIPKPIKDPIYKIRPRPQIIIK